MKINDFIISLLLLTLLEISPIALSAQNLETKGAYSPAIWANSVGICYGIRPNAILELEKLFNTKIEDPQKRREQVVSIVKRYQDLKTDNPANPPSLSQVQTNSYFPLPLQTLTLLSEEYKSPVILSAGNVEIEYNLSTKAFWNLYDLLASQEQELNDWPEKFSDLLNKYYNLEHELSFRTDRLAKKALKLLEEGELEAAREILKKRYSVTAKNVRLAELTQADAAFDFGQALELNLKFLEARPLYEDAIRLVPTKARFCSNYSDLLLRLGIFDSAIKYLNITVNIDSTNGRTDSLGYYYNNLGEAYRALKDFETAFKYYNFALEAIPDTSELNIKLISSIQNNIGMCHLDKSHYQTAIIFFKKAIDFNIKHGLPFPVEVSRQFNNLALAYYYTGQFKEAITYYEKAIKIDTSHLGQFHPDLATLQNNLGLVYGQMGQYDQALMLYRRAINIDTTVYGQIHPNTANDFNNIGVSYLNSGNYELALQNMKIALKIDSTIFGLKHPRVSRDNDNIGVVYNSMGQYEKALYHTNLALSIDTSIYGLLHIDVSTEFTNLGKIYLASEQFQKSISPLKKAIYIDSVLLGMDHFYLAIDYKNLGSAYMGLGAKNKAIELFEKALAIDTSSHGLKNPVAASILNALGHAYLSNGNNSKSIETLELAFKIDTALFGLSHHSVARVCNNLGRAYSKIAKYDEAIEMVKLSLKIYEEVGIKEENPLVDSSLVNLSFIANQYGSYLQELKEFIKAHHHYKLGLEMSIAAKDTILLISSLRNLGANYTHLANHDSALICLNWGISLVERDIRRSKYGVEGSTAVNDISNKKNNKNGSATYQLNRLNLQKAITLKHLGKDQEAQELLKDLWILAEKINDNELIENIKSVGYNLN